MEITVNTPSGNPVRVIIPAGVGVGGSFQFEVPAHVSGAAAGPPSPQSPGHTTMSVVVPAGLQGGQPCRIQVCDHFFGCRWWLVFTYSHPLHRGILVKPVLKFMLSVLCSVAKRPLHPLHDSARAEIRGRILREYSVGPASGKRTRV